ncbi:putative sodium/metabolite cotransporter BASS4, chloroplastic [Silene latifolia]|uniref:putative sodium/metabolite cotransporter BASS4, chloroplastic n=1 Tax=Silene latifolia TaxID=37657 RepID=UPI003D77A48C
MVGWDVKINDGGNSNPEAKNSGNLLQLAKPILDFTANNFLPLALVGGVALGLANLGLGCLADQYSLSKVSTFCIFIISGLTLRSQEIGAAKDAWPVGLFGVVSILLLTPVFSRLILLLNFQPPEFVTGLAIFTCMPTSLSSGVSLTQLAKGNFALALAMTVISNLLGILVVPFTVSKFVGAGVGISIPTEQLFKSLVITLLIPLILGKVLREAVDGVGQFADNNRKLLSIISALFLSLVPWIQVSKSRSLLMMVNPTGFLLAIGLGAVLHIVLLVFNALAIKTLSLLSGGKKSIFSNRQNAIAFLLVASQKTLPVTVAVVDQLGGAMGASGLLVLPCVAAHLNQIILGSFLVNFLLKRDQTAHLPKAA